MNIDKERMAIVISTYLHKLDGLQPLVWHQARGIANELADIVTYEKRKKRKRETKFNLFNKIFKKNKRARYYKVTVLSVCDFIKRDILQDDELLLSFHDGSKIELSIKENDHIRIVINPHNIENLARKYNELNKM
jgi:hypothetical protein